MALWSRFTTIPSLPFLMPHRRLRPRSMHSLLRKFARSAKSPLPLLTTAERKGTLLTNSKSMLLLLDNYDSFTYNLAQYFGELGCELLVKRNDEISLNEIAALTPNQICISPGPCTPREAGISKEVILRFGPEIPILGVCLGHQCIAEPYGGMVVRACRLLHGKLSVIR